MNIAHITINTSDLASSISFYREILGLRIAGDLRANGLPIVFLSSDTNSTCIELIENAADPYSGSGLSIGFHVENVEETRADLEKKGLHPSPIISPTPNVKFFFIRDPNGVSIQLI